MMESTSATANHATAVFAAGCFWGVEEAFRELPGVIATRVGYTGGTLSEPTYEIVCTDATGHAEAVEVTYDPTAVSYEALLDVFWNNHDPTTKNRQGPDIGSQYRSAIFYHSDEQKKIAEESLRKLDASKRRSATVVTQIIPAQTFWPAEEHHQKYLFKRGLESCHI